MNIWIDGRAATAERLTGKGQWSRQMITALCRHTPLTVLTSGGNTPPEWTSVSTQAIPGGPLWHLRVRSALLREKPDAYIAPTSFIVPALIGSSIPVFPVIHDLIALQDEPHEKKARWIERLTLNRTLRSAKHIFTISTSTKQDVLQHFPFVSSEKITVIGAGPLEKHPELNVPDGITIFCPATLCPRKNQLRLIEAYAGLPEQLRSTFRLVLTGGRGWQDDAIVEAAKQTNGVEWRGFVSAVDYRQLLSTCTILAWPSLYEGFGLPVLDALQRGIPVLTSNRSSLPEVAGNCAVFVDPESIDSIREGLSSLLTNEDLRKRLRQQGPVQAARFSWEKTAGAMWEVIAHC